MKISFCRNSAAVWTWLWMRALAKDAGCGAAQGHSTGRRHRVLLSIFRIPDIQGETRLGCASGKEKKQGVVQAGGVWCVWLVQQRCVGWIVLELPELSGSCEALQLRFRLEPRRLRWRVTCAQIGGANRHFLSCLMGRVALLGCNKLVLASRGITQARRSPSQEKYNPAYCCFAHGLADLEAGELDSWMLRLIRFGAEETRPGPGG